MKDLEIFIDKMVQFQKWMATEIKCISLFWFAYTDFYLYQQ